MRFGTVHKQLISQKKQICLILGQCAYTPYFARSYGSIPTEFSPEAVHKRGRHGCIHTCVILLPYRSREQGSMSVSIAANLIRSLSKALTLLALHSDEMSSED
jgi:hypothetical protein